jgi:hypothetical protein
MTARGIAHADVFVEVAASATTGPPDDALAQLETSTPTNIARHAVRPSCPDQGREITVNGSRALGEIVVPALVIRHVWIDACKGLTRRILH